MNQYVYDVINEAAGKIRKSKLYFTATATEYLIVCDNSLYTYYLAAAISAAATNNVINRINVVYEGSERSPQFEEEIEAEFPSNVRYFNTLEDYVNAPAVTNNAVLEKYVAELHCEENEKPYETENHEYVDGKTGEIIGSNYVESDSLAVMFFTNLQTNRYNDNKDGSMDERLALLKKYFEFAKQKDNAHFNLITLIPEIEDMPGDIEGISEREYEVIYADKPENSKEKFVIKLENACRTYVVDTEIMNNNDKAKVMQINAMRIDAIIGPFIKDYTRVTLEKYLDEIKTKNTLTISDETRFHYYSVSSVQDAVLKTLAINAFGVNGNTYQISSWHFNLFEMVYNLYTLLLERNIKLEVTTSGNTDTTVKYHILNPRKIMYICTNKMLNSFKPSLRKTVHRIALAALDDNENYQTEKVNVYYGKIDIIRQLELNLMKEVDRICKKHNIKYFLAGGSMLGAIRHGGFIPWDDDMDIGMLPEDYKRFVQICPGELSDDYFYQTTDLEPESLYIHDKIRIKNTKFATKYANQFRMHNGVYIDIFVYYKTSDNPKKQDKHIRKIMIMRRVLGMRWVNRPRRNVHYYFSKVALPFMRLLPTSTFRHMYINLLEKYEKKDTHFRIDGSGFNLKKVGGCPIEWFNDVTYTEFCGYTFPILARYDDYLRHWYGDKYMELLPVSKRTSVHDVVSIDLGEHLLDGQRELTDEERENIHIMDLRGDLYEYTQKEIDENPVLLDVKAVNEKKMNKHYNNDDDYNNDSSET